MAFNPSIRLTADMVSRLLANEEPESQVLDYKRELPVKEDDVRHDFLEDVTAFANTAGGVIIYGVNEKQGPDNRPSGIPEKVVGLGDVNLDGAVQRLGAKLDQLVKPRIPGVQFDRIPDAMGGPVLAVRVPRSWQCRAGVRAEAKWCVLVQCEVTWHCARNEQRQSKLVEGDR